MVNVALAESASTNVKLDRAFYTRLRARAAEIVPIVGAGLAAGAGVPGFGPLITHLVLAAEAQGGRRSPTLGSDPFEVVDELAEQMTREWVASTAAEFIASHPPLPTPALQVLARVPSRLILTTNYDLAIEKAAEAVGQPVVTLTVADVPVALQPPGDELRVLHLHGVVSDPASIVLTWDSYEEINKDERVQLVLRAIASRSQFVFLGHSLSDREVHLRRDIGWSIANFPATERQHLLIADRVSIDDPDSVRFKTDIEQATGVTVALAGDPDRAFTATLRTAHVLAGEGTDVTEDFAPTLGGQSFDPFYVSPPVADSEMISTPGGQGRHMAQVMQHGETYSTDLDVRESCLLLVAGGGFGKTEELRQIGRRATGPALLQALSALNADQPWTEVGARFVSGMSSAQGLRSATRKLTLDRLREQSYVFLLDGLDEVPIGRRPGIARLITEVAAEYPQHRFVLTSRPIPAGLDDLPAFAQWSPVPDHSWLEKYCLGRGVPIEDLIAALPDTGDISELIKIPIYANAAVGRVHAGEALPSTALELVLDLADQRTCSDPRMELDPDPLRVWLDRLALCMMMSQTTDIDHQVLINSALAQDLPGMSDGPDLVALVASRALITDVGGSVRFPANVVREARASRAILSAGESGLQLLLDHVLVELPVSHGDGEAVRAVRPTWVRVVEQLLPLAPPHWREVIARFDSVLVARATATSADEATRHAAIQILWDAYVRDRIWLQSNRSGDGSGDEEALQRLIGAGVSNQFVAKLVEATSNAERTNRGNAVRLLPFTDLDDEHLRPIVAAAITDPDGVVRRFAAIAAYVRKFRDLVPAMISQAEIDTDELAPRTLLDVALDLASEDDANHIARTLNGDLALRARRELVRRLSRTQILDIAIQDNELDSSLLHELLEESPAYRQTSWAVEDVVALARIAGAFPSDVPMHEVARILGQHPAPAILAFSTQPKSDLGTYDLHRLGRHLSNEAVIKTADALRDPSPKNLRAADFPTETIDLDEAAQVDALNVLESIERNRNHTIGANDAPARSTEIEDPPTPAQRSRDEHDELPEDWQEQLREAANRSTSIPPRSNFEPRVANILRHAARTHQPLGVDGCKNLATFLLSYDDDDLAAWLHDQWVPEAAQLIDELKDIADPLRARLATVLPGPWPDGLADQVLDAVGSADIRLGNRLTAVAKVAEAAGGDTVRSWAATHEVTWIDPALVRLGDCESESRLIAGLAGNPSSIRRYPDAYDEEWVSALGCRSSAGPLAALIKTALTDGGEHSDLEGICKALSRCAGLDAPRVWDKLISDVEIPASGFLVYDKRAAIADLIDQHQPPPSCDDSALQERVRLLVVIPAAV